MVLDEITHNKVLVDAVEDLIGPDILNCGTVLFIKEAHDPGFVSWHQDGRYMGLDPLVGVTAWVALSPATEVSGCMAMVPGVISRCKNTKTHMVKKTSSPVGKKLPMLMKTPPF